MGHARRFQPEEMRKLMADNGLEIERMHQLNKISAPIWWVQGNLLRRKRISKPVLKLFDKTVWLWKRLDPILPWRGLSLVVVARKKNPRCLTSS